jgi:ABC-type polysaccharide/polyol phosphate export permease
LLPWQYFTNALTKSTNSVVDNASLVSKIYFPRLIIPLAGVLSNLVDFFVSAIVLAIFLLAYRVSPTPAVVWLPFFLLLAILTALGFGLWLIGAQCTLPGCPPSDPICCPDMDVFNSSRLWRCFNPRTISLAFRF